MESPWTSIFRDVRAATHWEKVRIAIPLLLIFAVLALAFQIPEPPPFEGDNNPVHDGQPKWCANVDTKTHSRNCDCKPMAGDPECKNGGEGGGGESPKCRVYCRKSACRCLPGCGHTE